MSTLRARARTFSLLSALAACLFAGYVVALTPHLVHHLFDSDGGQAACPLFALSDHTPQARGDTVPALTLPPVGCSATLPNRVTLPVADGIAARSRAPPVTPQA